MRVEELEAAASRGSASARLALAHARLGDVVLPFDASACVADMHAAASAGDAAAARALGMAWAAAGELDAARAALTVATAGGDGRAAFLLARISADAALSQGLDSLAVERGVRRARAFVETPHALPKLSTATLPPMPPPASLESLVPAYAMQHERPWIATCEAVLSALECEYVIAAASGRLQPSFVHDPHTGGPMRHPMRTSHSMTFAADDDGDFWLRVLQRRLATIAAMPLRRAEPLAVLRYARGEEYRPHRDYLRDPAALASDAPGQRLRTVFVYLSDVAAGGATDFPLLGVRIAPRRGRVVVFDNIDGDGQPDPDTLHAGMPVEQGRKFLATLWLRERDVRAW